MNQNDLKISVVIPCFNEEATIAQVIQDVKEEIGKLNIEHEIIVVNDSSTDKTGEILAGIQEIEEFTHPYNKGQGAALKTGARNAKYDWLLFFDADGQHRAEYVREMIKYSDNYDLISAERMGYQGPIVRQPGKLVIHWLARYLLGHKIKDFNCGLRLIKKQKFLKFAHILPEGFSWATTSIFAFVKENLNVKFVPVKINKREAGKSLVKPKEAARYFMLILRLIMLFSPLRIFFPVSMILFFAGIGFLIYDLTIPNISEGTIFILITSILVFFFGLIADQIAALRREVNRK